MGEAPSTNVGKTGKSKSECHGKRLEKMRNIRRSCAVLKRNKIQQKAENVENFGFKDLIESEQWIVADGTGAELFIIIFLFFQRSPNSRYQSPRGNCCISDGGIQCLIQNPQKACISIKIHTDIEIRG